MGSGKGQLAMNETFYLIAGIVICLIVVIFVISILGGGKGWLDWACREWPKPLLQRPHRAPLHAR